MIRGRIDTGAGLTDVIPVQGMRNAPHLDFAGEIREATGFPTFHAGKVPDLAIACHAIASGKVDMIGLIRAHMADPHIVEKLLAGEEDKIRPASVRPIASIASTKPVMRSVSTTRPAGVS